MASVINFFDRFFRKLLKDHDVKNLIRLQNIQQMMRDAVHLFFSDLCGADIHPSIDLHGVRGYDLSLYRLGKGDGKGCLSDGSWARQNDKRTFAMEFFFIII